MAIKSITSSSKHPEGGLQVIWGVWKAGKLKRSLWFEDFPSKKDCRIAARQLEIEFDRQLRNRLQPEPCSLKCDFKSVTLRRIEHEGDAGMRMYFDRLISMVGEKYPDDWRMVYLNTIQYLEQSYIAGTQKRRSESTINRYKSVFRMIFNFAKDERIIGEIPVNIKLTAEEGRDRIWTVGEREKIFEVLKNRKSWLLMPVYFSSFNPIRAGDLFNLQRHNWRPLENWVEFYASKTTTKKAKSRRPTYLRQIDDLIRDYFNTIPLDCPFLFPRINSDGSWHQVNCRRGYREYDKEWDTVLNLSGIHDFHWHDLKHCAITFLMDNGYSELDMRNCGIQYTKSMIDRYYNFDASKAPELCGFEKPKTLLRIGNE